MIVCFSGTGNSRWCAERLGRELGQPVTDAFPWMRSGTGAELESEEPWIFTAPTYAWQLPRVFVDFLRRSRFSGSRQAYFVMTCGSDTGNAPRKNRELCAELGFECLGTLTVRMPENYIAKFNAPKEPKARAIVEKAVPVLQKAALRMAKGEPLPEKKPSLLDRFKSGPVNDRFYPLTVKDGPFVVSDACIGCGRCAAGCVTDDIRMADGRPAWQGRCTHCMACICNCPVSAIEYGRISVGKPRYHCPQV